MNLINIIQWCKLNQNSETYIFDDIKIPSEINKTVLINNIMDKCEVHTPIYEDPYLFKAKIDNFFLRNYDVYLRLVQAFNADYNPIDNYNKTERWVEKTDGNENIDSTNNTVNGGSTDIENRVSAYNSNSYQPKDLTTNKLNTTEQNTGDSDRKYGENVVHEGTIKGNVGVTTSQQMLESELLLRPKLNIYEVIANDFYNEFMVYVIE